VSEALEAGRNGQVWGVIHFGHNFTEEFEIRQEAGDSATLENIIRSRISVNIDSSSAIKKNSFELIKLFPKITNFLVKIKLFTRLSKNGFWRVLKIFTRIL
jgi:hypothetical protein